MTTIDIKGLDKAQVLAALFNGSQQQGSGFLDKSGVSDMTVEDAAEILDSGQMYFYYVRGRILKVDLLGDEFNPALYDRDNGPGAADLVIAALR